MVAAFSFSICYTASMTMQPLWVHLKSTSASKSRFIFKRDFIFKITTSLGSPTMPLTETHKKDRVPI